MYLGMALLDVGHAAVAAVVVYHVHFGVDVFKSLPEAVQALVDIILDVVVDDDYR